MEKIAEKIREFNQRKFIFADKERLKKGKIYLPRFLFLISSSVIKGLIATIKRVKPAVEFNYNYKYRQEVEHSLKKLKNTYGLRYKISDYKFLINSPKDYSEVVSINDRRKGLMSCSLSFDQELAEKSEEYFLKKSYKGIESDEFSRKFADIMGYPDCCIRFGETLSGNINNEKKEKENFVWSKSQIRSYMNSRNFSPLLNIFTFDNQLISHIPCKLDCKKSERYARKMLNIFKQEDKPYSKLIEYFLNLHSLFWYYSEFILFKGKKINNFLKYNDFLPVSFSENRFFGKLDENFREKFQKAVKLLNKGNGIRMKEDCFEIYNDNKLIGSVKKNYKFENILF